MKITKEEIEIEPMKEGDNEFVWMLKAYGEVLKNTPELLKKFYIDPLIALGKATVRRPILVNPSGRRTSLKRKDSRWFFDDPKYGTAGQGYLPIWHYIPRRGFVDAHEGAKYYGLLDGVNAVDQDVLDKSNRDLQNIIRALQKRREKRVQKENKTMKITKEELANIIKEEVEKAISEKTTTDEQALGALQTDRAKRAYMKLSDEDKARVGKLAQDGVKKLIDAGYPKWYVRNTIPWAVTFAMEASGGSIEKFAQALQREMDR
jgi:hypothetical protein